MLGCVGAAALVGYIVQPQVLLVYNQPALFYTNIRYGTVAMAFGLVLLPISPVFRSARVVWITVGGVPDHPRCHATRPNPLADRTARSAVGEPSDWRRCGRGDRDRFHRATRRTGLSVLRCAPPLVGLVASDGRDCVDRRGVRSSEVCWCSSSISRTGTLGPTRRRRFSRSTSAAGSGPATSMMRGSDSMDPRCRTRCTAIN